eukprot:7315411-Pyramimonas_sp.AAC.1
MPEDLHEAMNEHSKEYVSRGLGMQYLTWPRAMELQACSRACANIYQSPSVPRSRQYAEAQR